MSAPWIPLVIACLHCGPAADFDIPPGPAVDTIVKWAEQAHVQVLFDYQIVSSYSSRAIKGRLQPIEALRRMLRPTYLTFDYVNDDTVAVYELVHFCHPELGAEAPLPPCCPMPIPIIIKEKP